MTYIILLPNGKPDGDEGHPYIFKTYSDVLNYIRAAQEMNDPNYLNNLYKIRWTA